MNRSEEEEEEEKEGRERERKTVELNSHGIKHGLKYTDKS